MGERGSRAERERTDWLLSLEARALLAAVSLTAAWQRNLFHSKRCLNGTANSVTTCRWQAASARQRRTQQGPDARSSSQSVPPQYGGGEREKERPGALLARRTPTMKQGSSDSCSQGQPRPFPPILGRKRGGRGLGRYVYLKIDQAYGEKVQCLTQCRDLRIRHEDTMVQV